MRPSNQKLSSKVNSDARSPESMFTKRRKRHPDDSTHHTVAMVIIYRSLGHLLPENYDPDRRSLRWEFNLSMNCADPFPHASSMQGWLSSFIPNKSHMCYSCALSCTPLAHCGKITARVEPSKLGCVEGWWYICLVFWVESSGNLLSAKSVLCILTSRSFLFFSFCRLPNRPIINTPVVSTAIHSDGELPPNLVEKPIIVEYAMLETEERTKPVCVFWNHSIMYVSAFFRAEHGICFGRRELGG